MSMKAEYIVKIGQALSEIMGRICPCLQFFSQKLQNNQTFLRSYSTNHHRIRTQCSHIQCASKLPIGISIFQSVSQQHHDKENFSTKNADFRHSLIGCCGNVPWAIVEWMHAKFIKPLHSSISHWKVGEDPSSSSWELVAPRSTTKNIKNKEKTSAKYTAHWAGVPGGLNYACWPTPDRQKLDKILH